MARRKKEADGFHREQIAQIAQRLFQQNGIENTTMDDIAKTAQYSKATLYVYFKNKDEIVGDLTLKSMKLLYERLKLVVHSHTNIKKQYLGICHELVQYQTEFPFYFEIVLRKINVNFEKSDSLPVEKEIFDVGEQINFEIGEMLRQGIENGALRSNLNLYETVLLFWASLSGILIMASNKQDYIQKSMGISKQEFLTHGFDMLYRSIQSEVTI